jgi:hypothetical protein
MIRQWEPWLKESIHEVDGSEPYSICGENEIVIHDNKSYSQYADTFHLMAKKVWTDMNSYQTDVGLKHIPSTRPLHKQVPNLF